MVNAKPTGRTTPSSINRKFFLSLGHHRVLKPALLNGNKLRLLNSRTGGLIDVWRIARSRKKIWVLCNLKKNEVE